MIKKYVELEFEIEFDHQPEEQPTRNYPGCAETIEVTQVKLNGTDITEAVAANPKILSDFEDACLEAAQNEVVDDYGARCDWEYEQIKDRRYEDQ